MQTFADAQVVVERSGWIALEDGGSTTRSPGASMCFVSSHGKRYRINLGFSEISDLSWEHLVSDESLSFPISIPLTGLHLFHLTAQLSSVVITSAPVRREMSTAGPSKGGSVGAGRLVDWMAS